MEKFDITRLKRNSNKIRNNFKSVNNTTIVTDDMMVMFPTRFINTGLCFLGNIVKVIGIYAIIDYENNYAICNVPIYHNLIPSIISDVEVDGIEYKLLYFDKDNTFLTNNKLIVSDSFIYNLFQELFIQGKIPWYLNYNDLSNILKESKQYAGNNIGNDSMGMEILTAIVSRAPNDKQVYYRQIVELVKSDPTYVGLKNIYYSFDNTGAKLFGSYFSEGLISALVDKEKKTSTTSEILRY